ncbi:unnamed protein product [Caenorhabditis nigoni]
MVLPYPDARRIARFSDALIWYSHIQMPLIYPHISGCQKNLKILLCLDMVLPYPDAHDISLYIWMPEESQDSLMP